jgi:hypothetical protein
LLQKVIPCQLYQGAFRFGLGLRKIVAAAGNAVDVERQVRNRYSLDDLAPFRFVDLRLSG